MSKKLNQTPRQDGKFNLSGRDPKGYASDDLSTGRNEQASGRNEPMELDHSMIQKALALVSDVRESLKSKSVGDEPLGNNDLAHPYQQDQPIGSDLHPFALADDPAEIPRSIGRFQIRKLLGVGGFSRVYLADDPTLNRRVALKILTPRGDLTKEVVHRFEREAKVVAVLNHPNIIPVYEIGTIGSKRYIAAAWSDGETLGSWLERQSKPLEPTTAAEMVRTLAEAIEHSHLRGIIHRDLKPANVLVEENDGPNQRDSGIPRLRITDFGMARNLAAQDAWETSAGAIVGTPLYMSPEQASGVREIAATSDIYSLGVIFYELLTGKVPIDGETQIAILLAIRHRDPQRPRQIQPGIPKDLESICLKCLCKNPEERYPTAHQLVADLERWLRGEPVAARRATVGELCGKWCRRNPIPAVLMAGIILALGATLFQWRTAEQARSLARIENDRAQRNINLSSEVIRELVSKTARNSTIPPEIRTQLTERAFALQMRLLEEAPEAPELILQTAWALNHLSWTLYDSGKFAESLEATDEALELLESIADFEQATELYNATIELKANQLRILGRFEEAMALLDLDPNQSESPGQMANRLEAKARTWLHKGEPEQALEALRKVRLLRESQGTDHLFSQGALARTLRFLGIAQHQSGQLHEAKSSLLSALKYQRAMANQISFHESIEEELASIQYTLGYVRGELNELELAGAHLQQSIESFDNLYEHNPSQARYGTRLFAARWELAKVLSDSEDWSEYERNLAKCDLLLSELDSDSNEYGKFSERTIRLHVEFAEHLSENGDQPRAATHLDHAEELLREIRPLIADTPQGLSELELLISNANVEQQHQASGLD